MITGIDEVRGDTITVATDGSGMYSSIQDAVNNSAEGDEILIYPGIYTENVRINRSGITLTGMEMNTTMVGQGDMNSIEVTSDNVTIRNLSVTRNLVLYEVNDTTVGHVGASNQNTGLLIEGCNRGSVSSCALNCIRLLMSRNFDLTGNDLEEGLNLDGDPGAELTSHSITSTNKVSGRALGYFKELTTGTLNGNFGQVILAGCSSVTLMDQNISDVDRGIQVIGSQMITMGNITLENCSTGIDLRGSESCTVGDSEISSCFYGINIENGSSWNWVSESGFHNNDHGINIRGSDNNTIGDSLFNSSDEVHSPTGVSLNYISTGSSRKASRDNTISGCDFKDLHTGVLIFHTDDNKIVSSDFSNHYFSAIRMIGANCTGNEVSDCIFSNTSLTDVSLVLTEDTTIDNCKFDNGSTNIRSDRAGFTDIADCSFRHSGTGIDLEGSDSNTLKGNSFHGLEDGLILSGANLNVVSSNLFNGSDLKISGGVEHLFYDNSFMDMELDLDSDVVWNISRTPGPSIIGGPYQGGNLWSNYSGKDLDGDGIGDTEIPHGPGDHLPLQYDTVHPTISDETSGNPTTGDIFEIRARPADERLEIYPTVEWWFGEDVVHQNESMIVCDPWGVDISIPEDLLDPLHYVCSVVDGSGNWNDTGMITRDVVDNDPPELRMDLLNGNYRDVGREIGLKATGRDNIELEQMRLVYVDVNGEDFNISQEINDPSGITTTFPTIPPQDSTGTVTLWLWGVDGSGNSISSDRQTITVVENPPPSIDINFPSNGSWLSGSVDISISAEDQYENISRVEVGLTNLSEGISEDIMEWINEGGSLSHTWNTSEVPDGHYSLSISAMDESKWVSSVEISVVIDNTPPVADAGPDRQGESGKEISLSGNGSLDDLAGDDIQSVWRFTDNGIPIELEGLSPSYTFSVAGTYEITLTVNDPAGNQDTDVVTVTIEDRKEPPTIISSTPENGAVDVSTDTGMVVEFSRSMDRESVGSSLIMTPLQSYRLIWNDDSSRLEMEFTDDLEGGTTYTIEFGLSSSEDGTSLDPDLSSISFRTMEEVVVFINITSPLPGEKVERGSVFTLSGKVNGMSAGSEVTVTFGGRTFSAIMGSSGTFTLDVMAPDETGTHVMEIASGSGSETMNIQVTDREKEEEDMTIRMVAAVLIIFVLFLAAFIWVRRGKRDRYMEE